MCRQPPPAAWAAAFVQHSAATLRTLPAADAVTLLLRLLRRQGGQPSAEWAAALAAWLEAVLVSELAALDGAAVSELVEVAAIG
jgi:hypothetical protein